MGYIQKTGLIVSIMFLTILLCECKKEIKPSSENTLNLFYLRKISNQGLSEEVSFTVDEQKGEITGSILKWIDSQTPQN